MDIHTANEYTNSATLLQAALDAAGYSQTVHFIYHTIPHRQWNQTEIAYEMAEAKARALALTGSASNLKFVFDAEYWDYGYANHPVAWPPLNKWRELTGRTDLPTEQDKYSRIYMEICNEYFAFVLGQINALKGTHLPGGCEIGIYAEGNMVRTEGVPPQWDTTYRLPTRADFWKTQWCHNPFPGPYHLYPGQSFVGIKNSVDFMALECYQLHAGGELASWKANKLTNIDSYRQAGWNEKHIMALLETAYSDGVPLTEYEMLQRLDACLDAGADSVAFIEFYNIGDIKQASSPPLTLVVDGLGNATFSEPQGTGDYAIIPGVGVQHESGVGYVKSILDSRHMKLVKIYEHGRNIDPFVGEPVERVPNPSAVSSILYESTREYQIANACVGYDGVYDAVIDFYTETSEALVLDFGFQAEDDSKWIVSDTDLSEDLLNGKGHWSAGTSDDYGAIPSGWSVYSFELSNKVTQQRTLSGGSPNLLNLKCDHMGLVEPIMALRCQNATLIAGKTYRVEYKVRVNTAGGTCRILFFQGGTWGYQDIQSYAGDETWHIRNFCFVANGTTDFYVGITSTSAGYDIDLDLEYVELYENSWAEIIGGTTSDAMITSGVAGFGGSNYLKLGAPIQLGRDDVTIHMKFTTADSETVRPLMFLGGAQGNSYAGQYGILMNNLGIVTGFFYSDSEILSVFSNIDYDDNSEHAVTVTYDRSGNMTIYIDGDSPVSATADISSYANSNMQYTDNDHYIGYLTSAGVEYFFTGSMSELKVWKRVLSGSEIDTLHGI